MLFKNESVYDEVIDQLEKNVSISKTASLSDKIENNKQIKLINKLNVIAEKLDNLDFIKEAEVITNLIEKIAEENPKEYILTHEGPDDYKREALEDQYIDTLLGEDDYLDLLKELDGSSDEDLIVSDDEL